MGWGWLQRESGVSEGHPKRLACIWGRTSVRLARKQSEKVKRSAHGNGGVEGEQGPGDPRAPTGEGCAPQRWQRHERSRRTRPVRGRAETRPQEKAARRGRRKPRAGGRFSQHEGVKEGAPQKRGGRTGRRSESPRNGRGCGGVESWPRKESTEQRGNAGLLGMGDFGGVV